MDLNELLSQPSFLEAAALIKTRQPPIRPDEHQKMIEANRNMQAWCDQFVKEHPGMLTVGPLVNPIYQGNVKEIEELLDNGADIERIDNLGRTPLHQATLLINTEVVRLLVKRGANVNAKTFGGVTPLHNAVQRNQIDSVKILLEAGADVNSTTFYDNRTPLHIAYNLGRIEIVELLLAAKADINIKDSNGKIPLLLARPEVIEALSIIKDE